MAFHPPRSLKGRFALLIACIALGAALGAAGHHFTGDERWFLAIPALLALAWLFVGTPERCMDGCRRE